MVDWLPYFLTLFTFILNSAYLKNRIQPLSAYLIPPPFLLKNPPTQKNLTLASWGKGFHDIFKHNILTKQQHRLYEIDWQCVQNKTFIPMQHLWIKILCLVLYFWKLHRKNHPSYYKYDKYSYNEFTLSAIKVDSILLIFWVMLTKYFSSIIQNQLIY